MAEIEVNNLGRYFGETKAVDGISFSVTKGEVLGFLGPNGAGKTTTMKVLTGFLAPTFGNVSILGKDIERCSVEVRRCMGYLPENAPLYGEMDVQQFLKFVAEVRGFSGLTLENATERVCERTGLLSVINQRIETLSKGFRRRVGLAQALIHDPEILILDEPTDGLDPNQKYEVRKLINEMASEKTIILSTHILEEVEEVCTRVVVISEGKIVADDTPGKLKSHSSSFGAVTISFEGEIPADAGRILKALPGVKDVREFSKKSNKKAFFIYPQENMEILTEVYNEAKRYHWNYVSLGYEQGHLDEVFRELTRTVIN